MMYINDVYKLPIKNTWDLKDPDLAHTADVFCWLKATSSGWVEGSLVKKNFNW